MAQAQQQAQPAQQGGQAQAPPAGQGLAAAMQAQNLQNQNYRIHKEQRLWADDSSRKMEKCEGLTTRSVREWLRRIANAANLLPAGYDANFVFTD